MIADGLDISPGNLSRICISLEICSCLFMMRLPRLSTKSKWTCLWGTGQKVLIRLGAGILHHRSLGIQKLIGWHKIFWLCYGNITFFYPRCVVCDTTARMWTNLSCIKSMRNSRSRIYLTLSVMEVATSIQSIMAKSCWSLWQGSSGFCCRPLLLV